MQLAPRLRRLHADRAAISSREDTLWRRAGRPRAQNENARPVGLSTRSDEPGLTSVYSVPISFPHRTRPRSGIDRRARRRSSVVNPSSTAGTGYFLSGCRRGVAAVSPTEIFTCASRASCQNVGTCDESNAIRPKFPRGYLPRDFQGNRSKEVT